MNQSSRRVLTVILSVLGGTAILLFAADRLEKRDETPPPKVAVDSAPLQRETKSGTSFAPMIKRAAPSVVNIYTTKKVRGGDPRLHPFFNDPWMRRFFGDEMMERQREREEQSLGSGVIVSEDGYILTNNHVVEGADEIKVALANTTRTFIARIIGADPQTDLAVIRVEGEKLPAIVVADSDQVEVGDVVLAIGNPFGVGQTVTKGIVSALGRGFGVVDYEDFIQTDASINPGNSGGALVDAEGRLVGINTAILSRTGGNQGVGFAVPINMARAVMEQIIRSGKVVRGFLGVNVQAVTQELAEAFNLPGETGALISEVVSDTPAAKAGLKEGDVIVEFNGRKVNDNRQLALMASQTRPNTKVPLKIVRDGKERELTAILGELPSDPAQRPDSRQAPAPSAKLEGVELGDLTANSRRQLGIPPALKGAVVQSVEPGSPAMRSGLRSGDVILEINHEPVADLDAAAEALAKASGDRILLRVWSQGGSRFVVVPLARGSR